MFDTCPSTEDATYWKNDKGCSLLFLNPQSLNDETSTLPLCNSFWRLPDFFRHFFSPDGRSWTLDLGMMRLDYSRQPFCKQMFGWCSILVLSLKMPLIGRQKTDLWKWLLPLFSQTLNLWMMRQVLYHYATASGVSGYFRLFFLSWCQDSNLWPCDDEASVYQWPFLDYLRQSFSNKCLVGVRYLSLHWRRCLLEDKKGINAFLKPSIFEWWGECSTIMQQLLAFLAISGSSSSPDARTWTFDLVMMRRVFINDLS